MSTILHLSREHGAHEFRIYRSNNDIYCHAQFDAERNIMIIVLSLRVPDIKFVLNIFYLLNKKIINKF